MKPPVKGCPKVAYRSELSAQLALARTSGARSARRAEARHYRCRRCQLWHLTSQPPVEVPL